MSRADRTPPVKLAAKEFDSLSALAWRENLMLVELGNSYCVIDKPNLAVWAHSSRSAKAIVRTAPRRFYTADGPRLRQWLLNMIATRHQGVRP